MTRFSFIGRSELELLLITVVFQIISLLTLGRVATGVATPNPPVANSTYTPPIISLPTQINQTIGIPASTPQFVAPTGNSLDASFILALLFVGANVVVIGFLAYLYRRKKMKWFSFFISLFLVFNVTELYFTFLNGMYSLIPIVASFVALGITVFAAFKGSSLITNGIALILALELGSSFPVLLQPPLNWIIPAVYAVFDIYAVYYGRLGKLVREVSSSSSSSPPLPPSASSASNSTRAANNPAGPGAQPSGSEGGTGRLAKWPDFGLLSVRLSQIEIGMADIAFYTMVPAVALVINTLLAFFVVMAAVDCGILLSFTIFRKSEVSPGLPVPILLGLGALLILVVFHL